MGAMGATLDISMNRLNNPPLYQKQTLPVLMMDAGYLCAPAHAFPTYKTA